MKESLRKRLLSDLVLVLIALIWGTTFVFQRRISQVLNPFLFNGYRFLLGASVLIPLLIMRKAKFSRESLKTGAVMGLLLFAAGGLQQMGLSYTTASNSGFITSLYVIFVPIFSLLFFRETQPLYKWLISLIALVGLYLMSITDDFSLNVGDLLTFVCSLFWAGHVLYISRRGGKFDSLVLAFVQFVVMGGLSLVVSAVFYQEMTFELVPTTIHAFLYAGILSTAIAYSLQVVAQKHAHPTDAAVIFSSEALFGAISGYLFLGEVLTPRQYLGCGLILMAIILVQIPFASIRQIV